MLSNAQVGFFLIFFLSKNTAIVTGDETVKHCPETCKCLKNESLEIKVHCTTFPSSGLPANTTKIVSSVGKRTFVKEDIVGITGLDHIKLLDLQRSQLEFIEDQALQMFPRLQILVLSNNLISSLNQKHFKSCTDLKEIYLEYNTISKIERSTFEDLENLEILNMKSNKLSVIPYMPRHLKSLDLSNNNINKLSGEAFEKSKTLKDLNLCKNTLNDIDFPESIFGGLDKLCITQESNLPTFVLPTFPMKELEVEAPIWDLKDDLMKNVFKINNINMRPYLNLQNELKVETLKISGYNLMSFEFLNKTEGLHKLRLIDNTLASTEVGNQFLSSIPILRNLRELDLTKSLNLAAFILPELLDGFQSHKLSDYTPRNYMDGEDGEENNILVKNNSLICSCILKNILTLALLNSEAKCYTMKENGEVLEFSMETGITGSCPKITTTTEWTMITTRIKDKRRKGTIPIGYIVGGFVLTIILFYGIFCFYLRSDHESLDDNCVLCVLYYLGCFFCRLIGAVILESQ